MSIAGSKELVGDFGHATQDLIKATRLQALRPHLKSEAHSGKLFLPHRGNHVSAVVRGILVGRRADLIVIDDPIAPARVHAPSRRRAVNKGFDADVISSA